MARRSPTIPFLLLARRAKLPCRAIAALKRRGHRRDPKRRFVLFCEGANTEPAYFAAVKRACSSALIEVQTIGGVGVPMTVAQAAVKEAKSLKRGRRSGNSFEESDRVCAIFDRDAHPRFEEAVALCESAGILVGRSDPCFELWLVLHERDYDQSCDRHRVQRELTRLCPDYDRHGAKTLDCDALVNKVEKAERRAAAQLRNREREGASYGNPSTTVGRLTGAIRDADERARP